MQTVVDAEVDVNGEVRLLKPIRIKKRSRATVTIFNNEPIQGKMLDQDEMLKAEARFAGHFGAVSGVNPNSADNELIDRDLAKEYLNSHEDE